MKKFRERIYVDGWNTLCRHAPLKTPAKHCRKGNEGKITFAKVKMGKNVANKDLWGCARHCKFFEARE